MDSRLFRGSTKHANKTSLNESMDALGYNFMEALEDLSKLYEDATIGADEEAEEEEAKEEPAAEQTEEAPAVTDAAQATSEQKPEAGQAAPADGKDDFNPTYSDLNTIKAELDKLPEEEMKKIEDDTISLEGKADELYDSLINKLNNSNLPSAVEILNIVAADEKLSKLLKHGFSSAANESKQVKVTVTPGVVLKTASLLPTQNVVVVGNSLDSLVAGHFLTKNKETGVQDVKNYIDYTPYFTGNAPVPTPFVYQAGDKNYIIDGHHRWSMAYCMNPFGTIKCVVVKGPDIGADAALKNFQAAIAAEPSNRDLGLKDGKGLNLFVASITQLGSTVAPMTEETATKIMTAGKDSEAAKKIIPEIRAKFKRGSDDLQTAKSLLISNALRLKKTVKPGVNDRKIMPQADIKEVSAILSAGAMPIETSGKK